MAFKKSFILSDESVNCYGFVVKTDGIRLMNAQNNMPCFYDHKTWEVPLGHWENLRKEGSKLLGDLVINGDNEREKTYINKIQNGDIKGASVGIDPINWCNDTMQLKPGQTKPTLMDCDLFEASITPLPGNTSALALKHEGNLITLSAVNVVSIIPPLLIKNEDNMKAIALKLGLSETATENEILAEIGKVQLARTNAEALNGSILKDAEKDLSEEQKAIFVELSKSNPKTALDYVRLTKTGTETTTTPAPGAGVKKDISLSAMIQKGKEAASDTTVADGKDSFDYLQKHNRVELARIQKEEPDKYLQLATAYQEGIRYKG